MCNSPVPWAGISQVFYGYGYGELVPANRPCEKYFHASGSITSMEVFSRGRFAETICGDVLLVYYCIYTSTRAREIPAHGTAGTAHTGTGAGTNVPRPHTREIPVELGVSVRFVMQNNNNNNKTVQ